MKPNPKDFPLKHSDLIKNGIYVGTFHFSGDRYPQVLFRLNKDSVKEEGSCSFIQIESKQFDMAKSCLTVEGSIFRRATVAEKAHLLHCIRENRYIEYDDVYKYDIHVVEPQIINSYEIY
jgi:hypothetical protein